MDQRTVVADFGGVEHTGVAPEAWRIAEVARLLQSHHHRIGVVQNLRLGQHDGIFFFADVVQQVARNGEFLLGLWHRQFVGHLVDHRRADAVMQDVLLRLFQLTHRGLHHGVHDLLKHGMLAQVALLPAPVRFGQIERRLRLCDR